MSCSVVGEAIGKVNGPRRLLFAGNPTTPATDGRRGPASRGISSSRMSGGRTPGGPFHAVLLISFGGPGGRDQIRPFLQNVLRGRRLLPDRVESVIQHYELFHGISPLTDITLRQAEGLRQRLAVAWPRLPVYVGMRNWHPFLTDTLAEMSRAGVRRALGIPLAAQHCYSSCGQYKMNVVQAQDERRAAGDPDVEITYAPGWHAHEAFIAANAEQLTRALDSLPDAVRPVARLVFTAHSIPESMAAESRYAAELEESAALVAQRLRRDDWALVYQSRSGRPQDPWLAPDICDYLRAEKQNGLAAAVLSPIGFVSDHIEVLYDLDTEAAGVCREIGLPMTRAESVNDHPRFLDMLADVVRQSVERYGGGYPLPIVPSTPPARTEVPPPTR